MRRPLAVLVGVLLLAASTGLFLTPGATQEPADTRLDGTLASGQTANATDTTAGSGSGATSARDSGLVGPLVIGLGLASIVALAVLARWRRGS
jgi:hypothetical protein